MPGTNCNLKRANIHPPLSVEILVLGFYEKNVLLVSHCSIQESSIYIQDSKTAWIFPAYH